jgi:hypothetical protein
MVQDGLVLMYETLSQDAFVAALRDTMTVEQAEQIKSWRIDGTWRAIAEDCHESYMGVWQVGCRIPGLQYVGRAITQAAAQRLGEDPSSSDWNGNSI